MSALIDDLRLPEGHYPPPWEWIASFALEPEDVAAVPHLGPYGECWTNAWVAAQRMGRRARYTEGLAWMPGTGRIELGDDQFIERGRHYPHAWVTDLRTHLAWECTTGWAGCQRVGVPLAHHVVARTFSPLMSVGLALNPVTPPLASWLELSWVAHDPEAIAEAVREGAR